ncbi:hypothetical protein R3P38DRAFT_3179526 [Favolaschia claudopus]|uniref:Uncharacterized protein n=1 Tax=Favolaschia claudopus TaxID=2862362 RepID=A0AAV9ZJ78_9AGAR
MLHPVGTSKNAKWEHQNNAKFNDGTAENDPTELARVKKSVRELDEFAEVIGRMHVRHSRCGKPYVMKTAYNTGPIWNDFK